MKRNAWQEQTWRTLSGNFNAKPMASKIRIARSWGNPPGCSFQLAFGSAFAQRTLPQSVHCVTQVAKWQRTPSKLQNTHRDNAEPKQLSWGLDRILVSMALGYSFNRHCSQTIAQVGGQDWY